jgi:hypothetical protein
MTCCMHLSSLELRLSKIQAVNITQQNICKRNKIIIQQFYKGEYILLDNFITSNTGNSFLKFKTLCTEWGNSSVPFQIA